MRFHGVVGFGSSGESAPDVWEDVITERTYFGDVIRNTRRIDASDSVNDELSVANSISIVADGYATEHFHELKFVEWAGEAWTVTMVEDKRPRLLLTLGTVYNGPRAA